MRFSINCAAMVVLVAAATLAAAFPSNAMGEHLTCDSQLNSDTSESKSAHQGVPGDGVPDILLYPMDERDWETHEIVAPAGTLMLLTDSQTLSAYVVRSALGVFTGDPANNLGFFQEDTDFAISGAMGISLNGQHNLGRVIGSEFLPCAAGQDWRRFWYADLTFTYTKVGQAGTFVGTLFVHDPDFPEPGMPVLVLTGGLTGLGYVLGKRRRARGRAMRRSYEVSQHLARD